MQNHKANALKKIKSSNYCTLLRKYKLIFKFLENMVTILYNISAKM